MTASADVPLTVQQDFQCTVKELKELMATRGPEGGKKLRETYGGVIELCRRLRVIPNKGKSFPMKASPSPYI